MKSKWKVSRSTIARPDGQRRWDYAYQFLVRWAMEQEVASKPNPLTEVKEYENGSSPICSSFDQSTTAKSNH
jgi:hypothetical protein